MAWIVRNLATYPGPGIAAQEDKGGSGDTKVTKRLAEMTCAAMQQALYTTGGGGVGPQVKTFA